MKMNSMTTEQKAKAYDQVREKIALRFGYNVAEEIFSEYEESEDERIKKSIINLVIKSAQNGGMALHKWESQQMLAWLEKQGEQKSIDDLSPQEAMDIAVEKCFEQGEQKPVDFSDLRTWKYIVDAVWTEKEGIGQYLDSPFTEEVAKKLQKRFGNIEQKPAWSEEDDIMVHDIDYALRCQITYTKSRLNCMSSWIGSLKYRVQSKREILEKLEEWLDKYVSDLADVDTASLICSFKNYLDGKLPKSFRHRSQWKPTDEQMDALRYVTNFDYGGHKATLVSLYEQLKKLRGE